MIGQLPPYALAAPSFRFRALASHAGRASLGGDREVALACFVVARIVAGMVPPLSISPTDSAARAIAARQWLASIAVPAATRAAASAVIDAVEKNDHMAAARGLSALSDTSRAQLDAASVNEITDLINELATAVSPAA